MMAIKSILWIYVPFVSASDKIFTSDWHTTYYPLHEYRYFEKVSSDTILTIDPISTWTKGASLRDDRGWGIACCQAIAPINLEMAWTESPDLDNGVFGLAVRDAPGRIRLVIPGAECSLFGDGLLGNSRQGDEQKDQGQNDGFQHIR